MYIKLQYTLYLVAFLFHLLFCSNRVLDYFTNFVNFSILSCVIGQALVLGAYVIECIQFCAVDVH